MQYLQGKPGEISTVYYTQRDTPYYMQSILQSLLLRLTAGKFLHDLQLVFTASFKSAGVVENITAMICKDELIVDSVLATLQTRSPQSAVINKSKCPQPLL
jgi:hypothetical protein